MNGYFTFGKVGCDCGGPCCTPPPAWGLGAITADQAAELVFPKAKVRSTPGFTQAVRDNIVAAAQSGQFVAWNQSQCSGQPGASNLQLVQKGTGLALSATGAASGIAVATGAIAAATGAIIGAATLGIGAIVGLFPLIFGHHAAAVAKERQVLCASVPAANNYLAIIDQAVVQGQATPQQAIAALQSLQSDFISKVQPILKMSASACNAACVWIEQLKAIVAFKTAAYQDLAQQATPAMTSGSGPTSAVVTSGATLQIPASRAAAPASSSSWLPIAALALVAFAAFKVV